MRILGDRIKYYRRNLGLSQKELAAGICTQATISLIEKKNKVPSVRILTAICERLNIDVEDIIDSHANSMKQRLHEIREELIRGHFDNVIQLIAYVEPGDVQDPYLLKQFYAYNGVLQLFDKQNADKAIFYFNQALNQRTTNVTYHDTTAISGLILSYLQKNDLEDALSYVAQLDNLLSDKRVSIYLDVETKLFIHYALGVALFKDGDVQTAQEHVLAGIKLAEAKQTILFLAIFYGLATLVITTEVMENQVIAYAMAKVMHLDLAQLLFDPGFHLECTANRHDK